MKLLIVGEGGQGIQLAGHILAQAAHDAGLSSLIIPNFGVEQRGGISIAFVQIDKEPLVYPKFEKATHFILLSNRNKERSARYIDPATKIIDLTTNPDNISPKTLNVYGLGRLLTIAPILPKDTVWTTLEKALADKFQKNPSLRELNKEALQKGLDFKE